MKHPEYIQWVRSKMPPCCICAAEGDHVDAADLHHFERSGMGMKCSDYFVAPVCRAHHELIQGKYERQLLMMGKAEWWLALNHAALRLIVEWKERIK
jgi:hypothetical protein